MSANPEKRLEIRQHTALMKIQRTRAVNKRDKLFSDIFRKKVNQLLDLGMSLSAISKQTGKSYKHVKQVAEQIKSEDKSGRGQR